MGHNCLKFNDKMPFAFKEKKNSGKDGIVNMWVI